MILNFGKHKGKDLRDVPPDYLNWMKENIKSPEIQKEIELLFSGPIEPKYDKLIYGKDQTERIVSISYDPDSEHMYVYTRDGFETIPYKPYVLTNAPSKNYESIKLAGDQYYKHLTHVDFPKYDEISKSWKKEFWTPRHIEEGFMLLNGQTYYKGMNVGDVTLFSFDIETTGLDPKDNNAKVLLISTTVRQAGSTELTRRLFDIDFYQGDERKMIQAFCSYLTKVNPDILLGHNVLSFDLPYLFERSGGYLVIGRHNQNIKIDSKVSKFRKDGSQQYEFRNVRCHGREIIDTLFLSIKYDIGRTYPSYGLKNLEKHLGLVDGNRTSWDFKKHSTKNYQDWGFDTWQSFRKYCEEDADSPIKLFDLMIPTFFYLASVIPKTMQEIINQATGSQLDSFMIRSYLQDGYSQPLSSEKKDFEGGTVFGIPGNYRNVFSVDFHALYPSIIKAYKLYDEKKDPKAYLLKATAYFTAKRVEYKKRFKETGELKYDGMQLSQKILANSIYGFTGSGYLLYNSPKISATITRIGRELLNTICIEATGKPTSEWEKLVPRDNKKKKGKIKNAES